MLDEEQPQPVESVAGEAVVTTSAELQTILQTAYPFFTWQVEEASGPGMAHIVTATKATINGHSLSAPLIIYGDWIRRGRKPMLLAIVSRLITKALLAWRPAEPDGEVISNDALADTLADIILNGHPYSLALDSKESVVDRILSEQAARLASGDGWEEGEGFDG